MLVTFTTDKIIYGLPTVIIEAEDATLIAVNNIQCVQLHVTGLKWQLVYPLTDILKFE